MAQEHQYRTDIKFGRDYTGRRWRNWPRCRGHRDGPLEADRSHGRQKTKENHHETQRTHQFEGNVTRSMKARPWRKLNKGGNLDSVAAIMEGLIKKMSLKVGDSAVVAIKATEVMVGK